MRALVALDFALGPELVMALERCRDEQRPFCLLDQRVSPQRRHDELAWLEPSEIWSTEGSSVLHGGRPVEDDIGLVMLTSGSSGVPKAAELSWSALRASASLTQNFLSGTHEARWYPCLPASHIGGLAVVLRSVLADATLIWGSSSDPAVGPAQGATHVAVVRTQLTRYDLSAYEVVLLGGGRPPGEVPDNVVTTWGMTETGSGVIYDRHPLPGVEIKIIDGELCLRSPTLFSRYRDAARPVVIDPLGREWFPTGDGAEIRQGDVHVRGRLGTVINSGGEKIWPEDLESAFASLDGVDDVAVAGRESEEWGEVVVAVVVGDDQHLHERLRDAAHERLGPWAKPKDVIHVSTIPRTMNGKIDRAALARIVASSEDRVF